MEYFNYPCKLGYRLVQESSLTCLFISFLFSYNVCSAAPFEQGNAKNGKVLHEENCQSCHNSMFPNGKGDEIYDKDLQKIKSVKSLYSMVEFCASNNGLPWFEEEIFDVSRYLNDKFYNFKN